MESAEIRSIVIAGLRVIIKKFRPLYHAVVGSRALYHGAAAALSGRRGASDHIRSTLSLLSGSERISGRPMHITIEPTNACNLECPVCETGAGTLGRAAGHMTLEQFRTIVDKIADHVNVLLFYFMGEPFLNRAAYDMIRHAKDRGIPHVTSCTNGDFVVPDKVIASGIDELNFQIGGMTQQTHQVYRINGSLERVFRNMRDTIAERDRRGAATRVKCGLILMKHNEHEAGLFLDTMRRWGVDEASIVDPCVRTMDQAREMLPTDQRHWLYDRRAFERGELKPLEPLPNTCPWIHYSVAIHVNGDVVPCCRDPRGEEVMGNLLREDLDAIWNGPRFREFRSRLMSRQAGVSICRLCSGYGVAELH